MQIYYVYLYLDTRKPGKYFYLNYEFDFLPFYVGKGKEDRCEKHLKSCYNKNPYFKNKINKIISKTGDIPKIIKIQENLLEQEAFDLEILLIKEIGRLDLKTGSLVNMTSGGEGLKNCSELTKIKLRVPFSEERKKKISCSKKGKKVSSKVRDLLISFLKVSVILLDNNLNILNKFNSIAEACDFVKLTGASIHRYCNYYYNMENGNTFRYTKDEIGQTIYINNKDNNGKRKYFKKL